MIEYQDQENIPPQTDRLNYISIPIELIACPFFTPKEKEVLVEMIRLSDKYHTNGGCTRSNKNLALRHRISTTKITNLITMANRLGFIRHREDTTYKNENRDGSTNFRSLRKLIVSIPEEWKAMGDMYNDAFVRENKEAIIYFESLEKELLSIPNGEITQELIKEIIFKNEYPPYAKSNRGGRGKVIGGVGENLLTYKGRDNKSKEDKSNKRSINTSSGKRGLFKKELDHSSSLPIKSRTRSTPKETPPYEAIQKLWNETVNGTDIPKVIKLTEARKKHINARMKDAPTLEAWKSMFKYIIEIPFLCGENNTNWIISFDWLTKYDTNFIKIMEKNYKSSKKKQSDTGNTNWGVSYPKSDEEREEMFARLEARTIHYNNDPRPS